jgi:hypothetical protein
MQVFFPHDGDETSRISKREWYRNGQRHRDDGPALEEFYDRPSDETSRISKREWYRNAWSHRDDGPAIEVRIAGVFHGPIGQ